jgi:hypothetical protein
VRSQRLLRPAAPLLLILAGACMWLVAAPAQAATAPDYQVFTVPSPEPQEGAAFGERVRAIDDVDGDAIRDVLMTASGYDGDDGSGGVLSNTGRVYVFSGRTRALLRVLEPPFPQSTARFGFWAASLGDVDGDGSGDFAVSAAGQTVGGIKTGQVYVYNGRTGKRLHTISPPESLGTLGAFGGDFGGNVIGPGDLSGDGVGDVVASASGAFGGAGAAYAFNGKTGAFLYKVSNPSAQLSSFGFGAAEVGDVNGDGRAEFQIGAPRFDEDPVTGIDVGRAYVINGATGAVLHTLLDPEPEPDNRFGQADADGISLGDITGDGRPDVYVDVFLANQRLAPADPALPDTGKAHLFNGATGAFIRPLHDPTPVGGQQFGASNASAGDVDQDGRPDQLVSARGGAASRGRVTMLGGPLLTTVLKVFTDPDQAQPVQTGALFGTGLASPGDVNGDGRPDYFISARAFDVAGVSNVGIAYAYVSIPPTPPPPPPPPLPITAPPPPPPPITAVVRRAGKLDLRVTPASDRRAPFIFRATGRLTRPIGVSASDGCRGSVVVRIQGGSTAVASRTVTLSGTCTYGATFRLRNRQRFRRASRLRFRARFDGNARVLVANAPSRFVRVR